jgi:hypothetical protein
MMSENQNSNSPFAEALGKTIGSILAVTLITAWVTVVASWTLEFIRG